jgi:hypothetical protein
MAGGAIRFMFRGYRRSQNLLRVLGRKWEISKTPSSGAKEK